jgi:hypothetical protein
MLSALWKWLFGGSLFLCIILGIALKLERIHSHKLAQRNAELTELRAQDKANYENAQRSAKALNDAQIQRVKAQQEQITHEVTSNLNARLESIRGELQREAEAARRAAGRPPAGVSSDAPCRAVDPAWMCLSPQEHVRAAENEERHDQLIDWNLKQSAIDPNK